MNDDDDDNSEPVNIKAGEEWLVVTCRQCGKPLLLEPVSPEMLDEDGSLALSEVPEVRCHHCGFESVYQSDEIRVEQARHKH